jgi:hypothetical protein
MIDATTTLTLTGRFSMNDNDFDDLLESVRDMGRHMREKRGRIYFR